VAFQIANSQIDAGLEKASLSMTLRPSKMRLAETIIKAVLDVAKAEKIPISQILRELETRAEKNRMHAA
jgi:hypothetical protein